MSITGMCGPRPLMALLPGWLVCGLLESTFAHPSCIPLPPECGCKNPRFMAAAPMFIREPLFTCIYPLRQHTSTNHGPFALTTVLTLCVPASCHNPWCIDTRVLSTPDSARAPGQTGTTICGTPRAPSVYRWGRRRARQHPSLPTQTSPLPGLLGRPGQGKLPKLPLS